MPEIPALLLTQLLRTTLTIAVAASALGWNGGGAGRAQEVPPVFVVRAHSTHVGPEGGYLKDQGSSRVLVFVHGFSGDPDTDFRCDDAHNWPEMIADDHDFPSPDIYVLGYPAPSRRGKTAIASLEASIVGHMESDGIFSRHRDVVFVAYAMGGLLIQQVLESNAQSDWIHKVRAVFLYGTPQGTAKLAGLSRYIDADPRLKAMESGGNNFILHSEAPIWSGVPHLCAYETLSDDGFTAVDYDRNTRGCTERRAIHANHANIVKPCQVNDAAYTFLEDKLRVLPPMN